MSRRHLLSLAGAAMLLARDARNAGEARADEARPMRLVLLMQANGVSQQRFWPDASGSSPILDPILSDPRLKARTTVVKGLFNHSGGAGNQHDQGFAGLLAVRGKSWRTSANLGGNVALAVSSCWARAYACPASRA